MRLLSELIAEYPAVALSFTDELAPLTTTALLPEYSFVKPLQSERNTMLQAMYQLRYELTMQKNIASKFVAKLFFQPNATVNLFYAWWETILGSVESNPQAFIENQSKVQRQQQALLGWGYAPYYINNPIAKILVSVAQPRLFKIYSATI